MMKSSCCTRGPSASMKGGRRAMQIRAIATTRIPALEGVTPAKLGYTMPGEFEKHAGCWMGWPYNPNLWRADAKPAQEQYAAVAKAISQFEPLTMVAHPSVAASARAMLADAPNCKVLEMPIEDGWTRDWGPTCIARKDPTTGKRVVAGVHWDYDCYGGILKKKMSRPVMMPTWDMDHNAGRELLKVNGLEVFEAPIHLEGGSIHSDGQGTLLVTEECLMDPSRNPELGKDGIEAVLKEYLGLKKVIWLWRGMMGDDAIVNGHVDNMACFARPGVVLMSWTDDVNDPQYEVSARNLEILQGTTDAMGRKLEVIKVPCPYPMFRTFKESNTMAPDHIKKGYCPRIAGERLPGSYINHYVANGGVVVPRFGGACTDTDAEAVRVLQKAYPDRKVVNVFSREVLLNAGNIHCITQQHVAAE